MADEEVGYYDPPTAERIWRAIQLLERSGVLTGKGLKQPYNPPTQERPIHVKNISGVVIPAFGCVQATGTVMVNDQCFLTVEKPKDITGEAGPFFFNLFHDIPAANLSSANEFQYGLVTDGPHANALSPALPAGTRLQPIVGSFELEEGGGSCYEMIGPNTGEFLGANVQRISTRCHSDGDFIRFKFDEAYETKKEAVLIWVCLSQSQGDGSEPPGPPLRPDDDKQNSKIIFHGHAFDVESEPFGSNYHSHLWLIQWCTDGSPNLNDYVVELQGWSVPGWSADAGTIQGSQKQQRIDSCLTAPGSVAYERVIFFDNPLDEDCDDVDNSCPLPKRVCGKKDKAKVISRPCGVSKVPDEDDEGYVEVVDATGSFLGQRKPKDWAGKEGFAHYVYDIDDEQCGEPSGKCYWIIDWIDWFEPVTRVRDIVFSTTGITISRSIDAIWLHCDLPDEVIDAYDCEQYGTPPP